MYPYDLQAHSFFSDGDESPEELAMRAHKSNLKGLILTDHNTIDGYESFTEACQNYELATVAGVELTARYQGIEIHVLGYSKKFNTKELTKTIRPIVDGYNERSHTIVEKCREAGVANFKFDDLLAQRPAGTYVTKYDIVRAITEKTRRTKKEISKMLNAGGTLHVPYGDWALEPVVAVEKIHQANGLAVLAHPGEGKTRTTGDPIQAAALIDKLIAEMVSAGLDGLEVRNSAHSQEDEGYYTRLAEKYGLFITGGSDWHGPLHHPERRLGQAGLIEQEWREFLAYVNKKTGSF